MAHRHKGGKMVSRGAYGCGFTPALICIGNANRQQDTFSKLMTNEEANAEWKIRSTISKIDPLQKFSVYPTQICNLDTDALNQQNNIEKCGREFLSKISPNTFKDNLGLYYKLLQMPIGGEPISSFNLNEEEQHSFLKGFRNLFKGLQKMHSNRFYHLDIKPDNTMVKKIADNNFLIRFIDFGLSYKL